MQLELARGSLQASINAVTQLSLLGEEEKGIDMHWLIKLTQYETGQYISLGHPE